MSGSGIGSFVYLIPLEREDGHPIPEATIYIYQVEHLELFPCFFLLAGLR